jgi:hypothetical protein
MDCRSDWDSSCVFSACDLLLVYFVFRVEWIEAE